MNKLLKNGLIVLGVLLIALSAAVVGLSRWQADRMVRNDPQTRSRASETPADYDMPYEELSLQAADGTELAAWYIPSQNGAAIIAQHGYRTNRGEMLDEAQILYEAGYGVMLIDLRAHGISGGEDISFGRYEVQDMDAGYRYLLERPEVDPERIGALGNSMGAATSILYTAQNPQIKALVTVSAFADLQDSIEVGIDRFGNIPAFPFAPLIEFFAEQQAGFDATEVSPVAVIGQISPRPVFLMQGGADTAVPANSGERLYAAAGQPKELWFEPDLEHVKFYDERTEEYEERVLAFFDAHLSE